MSCLPWLSIKSNALEYRFNFNSTRNGHNSFGLCERFADFQSISNIDLVHRLAFKWTVLNFILPETQEKNGRIKNKQISNVNIPFECVSICIKLDILLLLLLSFIVKFWFLQLLQSFFYLPCDEHFRSMTREKKEREREKKRNESINK